MTKPNKLLAMTGDLLPPAASPAAAPMPPAAGATPAAPARTTTGTQFPGVLPGAAPKTGPGQMLAFRGQMLNLESETQKLRDQLHDYIGSLPTRKLDPAMIEPSRWSNRHPDAFKNAEFARLKEDLAAAGGNVQAILVRPLSGSPGKYEVVFGHRRHRGCLELGLQVLSTIETGGLSDIELFAAMDRENRERADLSPYEQGVMYRKALDDGMFPSARRLAENLGVTHTWVNKALKVADLPDAVLACFRSPIEVQHRHAELLAVTLEADRKGLLRRAEKLRQQPGVKPAGAVVAALLGRPESSSESKTTALKVGEKLAGKITVDGKGRYLIQLESWAISSDGLDKGVLDILLKAVKR